MIAPDRLDRLPRRMRNAMANDPNSASLLEPEERVLSTLENDGSRRWLSPASSSARGASSPAAAAVAYIVHRAVHAPALHPHQRQARHASWT